MRETEVLELQPCRALEIAGEERQEHVVSLPQGGCAGVEYTMEHATEIGPHNAVVEKDGARVLIAPMAQMFLIGTEIDYQSSLLESGFVFNNPNVSEACGCGESIKFREEGASA